MQKDSFDILIFLIFTTALVSFMILFVAVVLFIYSKRQSNHKLSLLKLTQEHERTLIATQLEIQEQTSSQISREIHDNIGLSLSLAKLHQKTIDLADQKGSSEKIQISADLITQTITNLSDISKGLNAEVIIQNGLLNALEDEIRIITKTGLLHIALLIQGVPKYLSVEQDLIIFRILQEAFNNVLKHSGATEGKVIFQYNPEVLTILLYDNGKGFIPHVTSKHRSSGIKNMQARIKLLNGSLEIKSKPNAGTILQLLIPIS